MPYQAVCNIKEYLDLRMRTQEELADWLGCSQGYVSRLAAGKKTPNVLMALEISRFFGCYVEDLWRVRLLDGQ